MDIPELEEMLEAGQSIDDDLILTFMRFYTRLSPNLIPDSSARERYREVTSDLPRFLDYLAKGKSKLLEPLHDRIIGVTRRAARMRDWETFMSLSLLPAYGGIGGEHGIIYTTDSGSWQDFAGWVLTGEGNSERRDPKHWSNGSQGPSWKSAGRVTLNGPGRTFHLWDDVERDNSNGTVDSIEQVVVGELPEEFFFMVFPNVTIRDLPGHPNQFTTSLNIQSWWNEPNYLVSRSTRNPYWDT